MFQNKMNDQSTVEEIAYALSLNIIAYEKTELIGEAYKKYVFNLYSLCFEIVSNIRGFKNKVFYDMTLKILARDSKKLRRNEYRNYLLSLYTECASLGDNIYSAKV